MITLASGFSYLDLHFLGVPRVIATGVVHGAGGVALIDPGPSSTLPALRSELDRAGIRIADVQALVLTHIHLDHAGACGTLVRENPAMRVYVHEKGAPHMIDPERLVASATRLWGSEMDRLWGEVRPVPREAVIALQGGERISTGGRDFEVLYTPGHASHHISYFNADSGIACVGDAAGIRMQAAGFVLPPTPPPDIDIDAWHQSLSRIAEWRPDTLFVTHFGPSSPVPAHLSEMADHVNLVAALAEASLAREGDDTDREAWFIEEVRRALRRRMSAAEADAYEVAGRFDLNWKGLARYWRKRGSR